MPILKEIVSSFAIGVIFISNKKYLSYFNMPYDPRPQRPVVQNADQLQRFLGQRNQIVSHSSHGLAIQQGRRPPSQATPTPTPINHEN